MNAMFKTLILAGALALVTVATPSPAQADRSPYWRSYWNWYDNTYQPYYYNYYGPGVNSYYYNPGYSSFYGPAYPAPYYSGPSGYYSGYGPGVTIQGRRGRITYGWW
jgi:hypothetical protein